MNRGLTVSSFRGQDWKRIRDLICSRSNYVQFKIGPCNSSIHQSTPHSLLLLFIAVLQPLLFCSWQDKLNFFKISIANSQTKKENSRWTPCFAYSGNFGRVIVRWHCVNMQPNVHLRARQKCVCMALIWKFCMRAWKTHLRRISRVMHNYNNFHAQTESVAGPKNISHRILNRAT
jgi:hypothetical protein